MMELIVALAIGVLTASGVWLLLRPRTFQVIIGLSLLSYAVNLFIFCMGRLAVDVPPIVDESRTGGSARFADPVPQSLVLTAIVIGFATTALFLVVIIAARGMSGTDHVDGRSTTRERLGPHISRCCPSSCRCSSGALLLLFAESRRLPRLRSRCRRRCCSSRRR